MPRERDNKSSQVKSVSVFYARRSKVIAARGAAQPGPRTRKLALAGMDDTGPPLLGASLGASSDASLASGVLLGVASAVIAAPPDLLPPMQGAHTDERPLSAPVQAAAMTDEEVQKLAEAEGLALVPAVGTSTAVSYTHLTLPTILLV